MPSSSEDTTTLALVGILVFLVLVLVWWVAVAQMHAARCSPLGKKGFTGPMSNWHLGSDDSGSGGTLHREPTVHHLATLARANPNHPTRPVCPPGKTAVSYNTPSGQTVMHCVDHGSAHAQTCGGAWHPESVSQVQTLAAMGAIDVHSPAADPALVQAHAGRRGPGHGPTGLAPHHSLSA